MFVEILLISRHNFLVPHDSGQIRAGQSVVRVRQICVGRDDKQNVRAIGDLAPHEQRVAVLMAVYQAQKRNGQLQPGSGECAVP